MTETEVPAVHKPDKFHSHLATCPICRRATAMRFEPDMVCIFGSCFHLVEIVRRGDAIEVTFGVEP